MWQGVAALLALFPLLARLFLALYRKERIGNSGRIKPKHFEFVSKESVGGAWGAASLSLLAFPIFFYLFIVIQFAIGFALIGIAKKTGFIEAVSTTLDEPTLMQIQVIFWTGWIIGVFLSFFVVPIVSGIYGYRGGFLYGFVAGGMWGTIPGNMLVALLMCLAFISAWIRSIQTQNRPSLVILAAASFLSLVLTLVVWSSWTKLFLAYLRTRA